MQHLYWSIVCKSENCESRHLLSYIGEYVAGRIHVARPVSIRFHCEACRKDHDYSDQEIGLFLADDPPPAGWNRRF